MLAAFDLPAWQCLTAFMAKVSLPFAGAQVAAHACLRRQDAWAGLLLCSPMLDVHWTPVMRCAVLQLCLRHAVFNCTAPVLPSAPTGHLEGHTAHSTCIGPCPVGLKRLCLACWHGWCPAHGWCRPRTRPR